MAMVTAIVNDANNPTRGSTPAMIENEIASGMSAKATTKPANTSIRRLIEMRFYRGIADEALPYALRTVGMSGHVLTPG